MGYDLKVQKHTQRSLWVAIGPVNSAWTPAAVRILDERRAREQGAHPLFVSHLSWLEGYDAKASLFFAQSTYMIVALVTARDWVH